MINAEANQKIAAGCGFKALPQSGQRVRSAAMRALFALGFSAIAVSGGSCAAPEPASAIFAPDARPEQVFGRGVFHTEGPAQGPDGRIYFCDVTVSAATNMQAGIIWVYDPKTRNTSVFRSPSGMASGIKFDPAGNMLVAEGADFGGRAVVRTDRSDGRSIVLAGAYNGRQLNSPNDLTLDRSGRVYFTDPRYLGGEPVEQPTFGIYRIDPDRSLHLVAFNAIKPNGLVLTPDQKTLYVTNGDDGTMDQIRTGLPDHYGTMQILAYDVDAAGQLSNRRVFHDFGTDPGGDGITVDSVGNLYVAMPAAGVVVFAPDGSEIARLKLPEPPFNLALTDQGSHGLLYITAGKSLYRVATLNGPPKAR